MLSVGSMLLNVPMERLKQRIDPDTGKPFDHSMIVHPIGKEPENKELADKFRAMLDEEFAVSQTLRPETGKWWGGNLGEEYDPANPPAWFKSPENLLMPDDWQVVRVLGVIRDACAHAHVITFGSGPGPVVEDKDEITRLLFVQVRSPSHKKPTKFRFVGTTPEEFEKLLRRWAEVIKELDSLGEYKRPNVVEHAA
jgi:hypothetical protein